MLEIRVEEGICIIKVQCELTHINLSELGREIENKINEGYKAFLLNLAGCAYINSEGFSYVMELYKRLKGEKKILAISNPVPDVRKLFEITKIDTVIEIFKTENEAIRKIDEKIAD